MFLRLAFAISTSIEPDILIMDEMISAGDAQFIEKAKRRLTEIVDKANILALASHDMDVVQTICNKVIWLERGSIKQLGPAESVVESYERFYAGARAEPKVEETNGQSRVPSLSVDVA
jgi:ABC-type polysaccharide/polyol phosphate transport system ATPase subunit